MEYKGQFIPVCIIDPIYGEFWQKPIHHLSGAKCNNKNIGIKLTCEQFINKAKEIHGDKYDYSKVEYINCKEKVCIICPKHGEFWQQPNNHLTGKGCGKCANKQMDTKYFIEKCNMIHNYRYNYSKVEYIDKNTYVTIICPIHGEYLQRPTYHLSGNGCPKCRQSTLEKKIEHILSEHKINYIAQYRNHEILGRQSLDFYLPDKKIAIECQGAQHFLPVDFAGNGDEWANNRFKKVIELDKLKKEKCNNNGIHILYFSDKQYNENIIIDENILMDIYKKWKN